MIRFIPNIISCIRLILVPLIVVLLWHNMYKWAFWVFIGAGLSDAIDGYLARILNARTILGSYLDPLADKAMIVCVYVVLGIKGVLPLWLVVAVLSRDILLSIGSFLLWLRFSWIEIKPLMISKLNTLLQILLVGLVLLSSFGIMTNPLFIIWFCYAVMFTTIGSGIGYMWQFVHKVLPKDIEKLYKEPK